MTLKSMRLPLLAALVCAGVAIGAVVFGASNARTAAVSNAKISLLDRPATQADRLPESVTSSPLVDSFPDPSAARLAFDSDGRQIYVVPGAGDSLCRVVVTGTGLSQRVVTGCPSRELVLEDPPVLTYQEDEGAAVLAVAVVPDGYDSATTTEGTSPIKNNVVSAVLKPGTSSIDITGPAGEKTLSIRKVTP